MIFNLVSLFFKLLLLDLFLNRKVLNHLILLLGELCYFFLFLFFAFQLISFIFCLLLSLQLHLEIIVDLVSDFQGVDLSLKIRVLIDFGHVILSGDHKILNWDDVQTIVFFLQRTLGIVNFIDD